MKNIILTCVCSLLILPAIGQEGVTIQHITFAEAKAKAKAENKLILYDFETTWCSACKRMDKEVLPLKEVGDYINSRFIFVKRDAEKGEGPEMSDQFGIKAFPTWLILSADGTPLDRFAGSKPAHKFIEELENKLSWINKGVNIQEISLQQAKFQAMIDGKYILLDCCTEWCGPCRLMEKEVFPLKKVGNYINSKFIFVRCDMEKGEGPELGKKFSVKGYPTYIILNDKDSVVHQFSGYKNAEAFLMELKGAIDKSMSPEALKERYAAGERDKAFLCDYIAMLSAKRDPSLMNVVKELTDKLSDDEKVSLNYWFLYDSYAPAGSENEQYLINNRLRFNKTIGEEKVTNLLAARCAGEYSSILMGVGGNKEETDKRVNELGLSNQPEVALYKATLDAKDNGRVDDFLAAFQKNAGQLPDVQPFIKLACYALRGIATNEQKEHFKTLTNDEELIKLIDKLLVVKAG